MYGTLPNYLKTLSLVSATVFRPGPCRRRLGGEEAVGSGLEQQLRFHLVTELTLPTYPTYLPYLPRYLLSTTAVSTATPSCAPFVLSTQCLDLDAHTTAVQLAAAVAVEHHHHGLRRTAHGARGPKSPVSNKRQPSVSGARPQLTPSPPTRQTRRQRRPRHAAQHPPALDPLLQPLRLPQAHAAPDTPQGAPRHRLPHLHPAHPATLQWPRRAPHPLCRARTRL